MTLQYVLFDLDDTLYPKDTPIMPAIGECIKTFLMDTLDLTYEGASQKRDHYNETYGTVLRGLLQEETVDIEAYLEFVHDIPVEEYLDPNPDLGRMLAAIPLRKFIFTNSYRKHAENVMTTLGVSEYFEDIFDIQSVDYVSKPARHPYITVVKMLDTVPEACVYIDDRSRNLREPKKLGMRTIVIDDEPNKWVDVRLDNVLEAGGVINRFLAEEGNEAYP